MTLSYERLSQAEIDAYYPIGRDGKRHCSDCGHLAVESHTRPDPDGTLAYGDGRCGDCLECVPTDEQAIELARLPAWLRAGGDQT